MNKITFAFILILSSLSVGCSSSSERIENNSVRMQQVNQLYSELKSAYIQYADSIKLATDSASLKRIMDEFEETVYSIYKKYPANMDKELSQGQNDTLWLLANKYIKVRDLHTQPEQPVAMTDTLSDSLSALLPN